ncbi:MucBP domain-containing protein [Fructilactobacillus sanfranciscensis]|uniref:MucBP domain-containing protein n=1 Tax=Fructilactobacillus sanfranciscensis TaxID=1625 RepID=UPI0013D617CB|nr:MucBP domain-containing protein [Fructilactobacillus sanfranciscensis]NDR96709.1 hypothetical protein [Fructilactobacillus sanfranciscensis]
MKIRKRLLTAILCASLLGGIGFYTSNPSIMTVKADTTTPSSYQGKIIVHHVDQNGNKIRPDTVATGASGTTYVAQVPQIKGYTYSNIENGQNNANGPQMVFGGGDPVTAVMSMTIVYTANSSKTNNNSGSNSSSNKNNSPATTPAKNGKSANSNSNKNNVTPNKNNVTPNKNNVTPNKNNVTPNSNNSSNSANKNYNSTKPTTKKTPKAKHEKANNDKKVKEQQKNDAKKAKKDDAKNNHHVIWIFGGIILAIVGIIVAVWKFMKKPSSDRH